MTQIPSQNPAIKVKPQPNIYTVLLIIVDLALLLAIGVVLYNLMSSDGYGLSIGDFFSSLKEFGK